MTCVQVSDLMFLLFWNVSSMLPSFVKNDPRICAQQTNENIAKNAISAHELQKPINGFHRITSSKLNRTLREFTTTVSLSNTALSIFKATVY